MGKHSGSIDSRVLQRIRSAPAGTVFGVAEFEDLGSRGAVYQALSRNVRSGLLRKVARGLYDLPRVDPKFGALPPDVDEVVGSLQRSSGTRLQPAGSHAANLLGLSEQVPVQMVYLTDGDTKRIRIGRRTVLLKRTTPRNMATAGTLAGTVIQALRWLGRERVDEGVLRHLRRRLSSEEREKLVASSRFAPQWIAKLFRQIAEPAAGRRSER